MYDTIIIGGGPAGVAAGVYAARKKMNSLLITEKFGGQSIVAAEIENWVGEVKISGVELSQKLEKHVRAREDIEIKASDRVTRAGEIDGGFKIKTEKGETYQGKTLIICSGGRRKKLGLENEEKFEGQGLSYCSICDAPLFRDKKVAVIGGGNAGLEATIDLKPYAEKIYLLEFKEKLSGDPENVDKAKKIGKAEFITNAEVTEFLGDKKISGLKYIDRRSGEEKELELGGVFVEIGSVPNSEFAKNLVDLNDKNEIVVNCRTSQTSHPAIFAAGDVTNDLYKQNNIAAGEGSRAALSAYDYLLKNE